MALEPLSSLILQRSLSLGLVFQVTRRHPLSLNFPVFSWGFLAFCCCEFFVAGLSLVYDVIGSRKAAGLYNDVTCHVPKIMSSCLRYGCPPTIVLYPRLVTRFRNYTFLRADIVSPTLKPEPGGPGYPHPPFFEVWYFSCASGIHDKRKYNPPMHNFKADSHIACRAHAVPLPCRAAKGLECVFPI